MGNFPGNKRKFTFDAGKYPSQRNKYPQNPGCIPLAGKDNRHIRGIFAPNKGSNP